MTLNLPQNLLFKINSIEDNSKYFNKKQNKLKKPILVEEYDTNKKSLKEKIEETKIKNKNQNNFNPFNFDKNSIINSKEDISFR